MPLITQENAPILQSLFTSVSKDRPEVGCTVRVLRSRKHQGKIGTVRKHARSRFVNPYRYGNDLSHCMIDARGRYGFVILIAPQDGGAEFWLDADNVMVCCTKGA